MSSPSSQNSPPRTSGSCCRGSVPPGISSDIYGVIIRGLRNKRVVLDTSGESLRLAMAAGPAVIKPNVDELAELTGDPLPTSESILAAARNLIREHGIQTVAVSLGRQGAIFVEAGRAVWAVPPEVEVVSTVGAGDAMVAGIVAGKLRGLALDACARLATAFSAAAIVRPGHSLPRQGEIDRVCERVVVRSLD